MRVDLDADEGARVLTDAQRGLRSAAPLAWLGGSVVALAFPSVLVPTINGIVVSCILYLILYPLIGKKKAA